MAQPQPFSVTPTYQDVPYANASDTQKLDIYLPSGDEGPFPTVIMIHGGAFQFGDKTWIPEPVVRALLNDGYAVVSMNYRLSDEAKFPAAVQDAKAAVRFLRANATNYNLDSDEFVAYGDSSGGNLASMVGVSSDVPYSDDPNIGNPGVSSRVKAVIDAAGPTDFSVMDEQAKAQGCAASDQTHNNADSGESLYLGAPVPTVPDLVQQSNPTTYIDGTDPPFLVQKGDQDCTVPIENTKMLADALRAGGVDVEYDLIEGAGHGGPVFDDGVVQNVLPFLNRVVEGQPGGGNLPTSGGPSLVPVLLVVGPIVVLLLVAGGRVVLTRQRP